MLEPWILGIAMQWAEPPIRAIRWVTYHRERQDPVKGSFLDTPTHTTLEASHLHLSRFTVGGPWVEGEGWYERG